MGGFRETLGDTVTILGFDEDWVLWRWKAEPTFIDRPYNAHPLILGRISGSGVYDLSRVEAEGITGLTWVEA